MKVHQIKYVPPSCVDMYASQLPHEDIARIPKGVDEVVYMRLEGVGSDGRQANAIQMILRKKKGYFRHSQTSQGGRKRLSNFNLRGKGKTLKELWRDVPEQVQADLHYLFAAAEELSLNNKIP